MTITLLFLDGFWILVCLLIDLIKDNTTAKFQHDTIKTKQVIQVLVILSYKAMWKIDRKVWNDRKFCSENLGKKNLDD
jgi:hypothetical protein